MKVYLARHGRTNYNDLGLRNADPDVDVHLTKTGVSQANKLAEELKPIALEHIYVSELRRTQQTADIVNAFHHIPVTIDPRLNDNRSGFEGRPSTEYYGALEKSKNKWSVRLSNGESIEDVKYRISQFIEDLKQESYEQVLIVTSMVIIQIMHGAIDHLSNAQAWELQIDQGSLSELEI